MFPLLQTVTFPPRYNGQGVAQNKAAALAAFREAAAMGDAQAMFNCGAVEFAALHAALDAPSRDALHDVSHNLRVSCIRFDCFCFASFCFIPCFALFCFVSFCLISFWFRFFSFVLFSFFVRSVYPCLDRRSAGTRRSASVPCCHVERPATRQPMRLRCR
jgi:hypothetical protein